MELKLDKRFQKRVSGVFGKYQLEVGVLVDGPHKLPKVGKRGLGGSDVLGSYAGGPVRKLGKSSNLTISQVSAANREHLGFNYLTAPFENKTSDIVKFTNEFFKFCFGRSEGARLKNLLQAIVRNPILRGDYGDNSKFTQKIKGFNRKMIDTAQLFKAITASVKVKRV